MLILSLMNTIYLIRHGQDEDNSNGILNGRRDTPLTSVGINQAEQLSAQIKKLGLNIDFVFSSPLQRALKTAQIVTSVNNFPDPIIEPLLIERDYGDMTGKQQSQILELCSPDVIFAQKINYFLSPPNAETFPDLIKRAKELLEKLNLSYQNKNILLVSHGDFGKMIYCAYHELAWKDVLNFFHFGNGEMLKLSPGISPQESKIISIEQYNT